MYKYSCYLIGLEKEDDFQQSIREVSRWVLIQATIILLILLMSLPWIKLVSMNAIERLHSSNVVWLTMASVFGLGMIMLIYISGYSYLRTERNVDNVLEHLSDSIGSRFMKEIKDNYELLKVF